MAEIFLQFVQTHDRDLEYDATHSPLRLASICGAWWAIVLSTCELWTHVVHHLPVQDSGERLLSLLQYWLPRAGSLPLVLNIELPRSPADEILGLLAQYSSQVMSLQLTSHSPLDIPEGSIHGPLSVLRRISLTWTRRSRDGPTPMTTFLDAPQLREARLERVSGAQISLPWIQLTKLTLRRQLRMESLTILKYTSNLQTLDVCGRLEGQPNISMSHLTLPYLRTIKLYLDTDSIILDSLVLPALHDLALATVSSDSVRRIGSMIARSGCSPCSLHLDKSPLPAINEGLLILPSLRQLTISRPRGDVGGFRDLFKSMMDERRLLPALESLKLTLCPASVASTSLTIMLSTRWAGLDGATRITSLSFSCSDKGNHSVEALDELRDLRLRGMDVSHRGYTGLYL
ncbi:hypothetical protein DFH07DRAFT_854662 [Mycena maculata]|uniref:F-box domain-containing protein n=1 Tax=Mycena maculata TaxID=230809 RepID=A0AAD7H5U8_9AGAR|nr:hypothetical protein DFH07DRAFT_863952 [Mycena maculata]KAJ7724599.1 hypothetical protein DFH07DRAFT_854662 [Mycena maculata]